MTGTAMYHAAYSEFSAEMGDRSDAPNIMIVVTDGRSKDKGEMTVKAVGEKIKSDNLMKVEVENNLCFFDKHGKFYSSSVMCQKAIRRSRDFQL